MVDFSKIKINEIRISAFDKKIHRLAEQMPLMEQNEFRALKKSLTESGQLEPIITYRGFILDGRNRINALRELGKETVKAQALPHKTEVKDLMLIVNAKEARRKQTKLQLAISGYNMWLSTGEKQDDVASRLGTSDRSIRMIKEMVEMYGLPNQTLKELHSGNAFIINNLTGESTTSLSKIYEILKSRANKNTAQLAEQLGSNQGEANPNERKTIEMMLTMASMLSDLGKLQFMNKFHELKE